MERAAMQRGRRGTGWAVLTMAVLMLMSSAWTAIGGSTGELVDDTIITGKVKASLVADPTVSALDIKVETSQGVVNLTGIVSSEQERQRAIRLAQDVEGVKRVEASNLFVKH
jgi:osmotically-inducible protein OsmY